MASLTYEKMGTKQHWLCEPCSINNINYGEDFETYIGQSKCLTNTEFTRNVSIQTDNRNICYTFV